jgi:UDP-N-acetyl-D-galactosamine dehydrogenase
VADETVKLMLRKGLPVLGSKVLVLGLTFKENCPDVRNTKVVDIVRTLQGYNTAGRRVRPVDQRGRGGARIRAEVPERGARRWASTPPSCWPWATAVRRTGRSGCQGVRQPGAVLFDVKSILPMGAADGRL